LEYNDKGNFEENYNNEEMYIYSNDDENDDNHIHNHIMNKDNGDFNNIFDVRENAFTRNEENNYNDYEKNSYVYSHSYSDMEINFSEEKNKYINLISNNTNKINNNNDKEILEEYVDSNYWVLIPIPKNLDFLNDL
jgi:hypothetical protein